MNIRIRVDLSVFERDINAAMEGHRRGVKEGLERVSRIGYEAVQRQKQITYSRPTDGWDRTGNWIEGTTIEYPGETEAVVITQGPAEEYEHYLANLNSHRRNSATDDAAGRIESQVAAAFEAAYEAVINAA